MSVTSITVNPVLRRELIERWRGRRAFWVLTAYVGLLVLVTLLLYWIGQSFLEQQMRWGGFQVLAAGPTVGRFLFENLLAFVLLLVLFIAPGYAAAQISGERERRTLALLQITLVKPRQIVAGKLAASVAWLLLLVLAALPVGAIAFFLGGVSLGDLARGLVTVVVVAVSVAALSLGISSLTRKTTASVVITYAVVLTLILGTLFAALVESAVRSFDFGDGSRPVALYANPFYGLADSVRANSSFGNDLPSVLTAFGAVLPQPGFPGQFGGPVMIDDVAPGADLAIRGGGLVGVGGVAALPDRRPVWLITLGVHLLLGALGFTVATRRVRADKGPRRRARASEDDRTVDDVAAPGAVAGDAPPPPPPTGAPVALDPPVAPPDASRGDTP